MRFLALATFATGCAVTQPFEGPLYTIGEGLTDTDHDEYVVAVTYIRVNAGVMEAFDAHVDAVEGVLRSEPEGLVGYALRAAIPGRDRWTMTVWTDEEALFAFVRSPEHLAAMADAGLLAEEARTTRFPAPAEDIPVPWDLALEALDEEAP